MGAPIIWGPIRGPRGLGAHELGPRGFLLNQFLFLTGFFLILMFWFNFHFFGKFHPSVSVILDPPNKAIYGYTVVNDFTVRDWQFRGPPHTMTMGKSWDTHCPFGPYIVTSDEIDDPHNLNLRTYVNNEERQNTNTSLMIFDCYTLIEYLSTAFTLKPGDLIPTGTPEGSALATQNWLVPGDKVRVEIDEIGFIENEIVQEPDTTKLL